MHVITQEHDNFAVGVLVRPVDARKIPDILNQEMAHFVKSATQRRQHHELQAFNRR
jgi:hypothetical protein